MRTAVHFAVALCGVVVGVGCGEPAPAPVPPQASPSAPDEIPELAARVDAEGFFEIEDASVAEAFSASPSVRAVAGRLGRLEPPDAADARVWVRAVDGAFESRRLERRSALEPLRPLVQAALVDRAASWGTLGAAGAFARLMSGEEGPPPGTESQLLGFTRGGSLGLGERTPRTEGSDGSPVPDASGADLAAWAPADRPFVRFRSVEAAYRFASEADRLASRLLAARGDGRDWGTLRWALYDLLLPTIWRTNPQGERGVGECAVVFETAYVRGRGEVAALLRITDPDLHRMQVLAGIGQEAEPDHLWRPEGDPFPRTRERRNFRDTRADVEWVATSEAAFEPLRLRGVRRLAADPEWRRLRGDGPPAREEAFLLFVPDEERRAFDDLDPRGDASDRAGREERGLTALGFAWTGRRQGWRIGVVGIRPDGPSALHRLVSARATTDMKGALVEATFEDEPSARVAEEALAAAARPLEGAGDVCRTNLRDLVPLAVCEAVPATDLAERSFVVLGWKPVCPSGGTYLVHPVTRETSCSLHGSVRRPLPEPPAPGPLLRDLARDGTTVRFRWPIDWDRRE